VRAVTTLGRSAGDKLLKELANSEQRESAATGFQNVLLEPGASVEMVTSTFARDTMIYIYAVSEPGKGTKFISSRHSDGGVVVGYGGPWQSLGAAKKANEPAPEGWTDV
jgi:hypothetical protein